MNEYEDFEVVSVRGEWKLRVEGDPKQKCPLAVLTKGDFNTVTFIRRFDEPWLVKELNMEADVETLQMIQDSLAVLNEHHKMKKDLDRLDPEIAMRMIRRVMDRKTVEESDDMDRVKDIEAYRIGCMTGETEAVRWVIRILENSGLLDLECKR